MINDYQIPIWRILCEGWRKIKGAWGTLLGSALLLALLPILFVQVPDVFIEEQQPFYFAFQIYSLLFYIFMIPLQIGIWVLGVQWIAGKKIRIRMLLDYFKWSNIRKLFWLILSYLVRVWIPILLFCLLLMWVFDQTMLPFLKNWLKVPVVILDVDTIGMIVGFVLVLGVALFIIMYWLIRYMMTIPLVFQKNVSPWPAMTMAAQHFDCRWFKLLLLFSTQYFLSFLLGVLVCALILWLYSLAFVLPASQDWSAFFASTATIISFSFFFVMTLLRPWFLTVYGIVYREMFENKKGVV